MEHHYLITEDIPEIVARGNERLPAGIDYEGNMYFRQERKGMLLGTYEPRATPWSLKGTPQTFGHELLEPKMDNIAERLELGFERMPILGRTGIKNIINGPFTFGPDGNPLIGPVPGMRNYWVAVGVMAGFCQGGGVGMCMAEWMMDGEPSIDVWAMDVARFGTFATPDWGTVKSTENYERRFMMTFPNETLPKGRRQKTTAIYDHLTAKGAVWGQGFGLEHALWFADGPTDAHETPTFQRSRAHAYVAREVKAVREAVGALEIANYAKHEVRGPGARAWLNSLLAGRVPKAGRLTLTPMLTPSGKLYGDLTVACLSEEHFMMFGSGAMQEAHRRWFERHLPGSGVTYRNVTDELHGIAISGPRSRALLATMSRDDVSNAAFKFMDIRQTFVAGVPAVLARVSFSGELGYEMYVAPPYQRRLAEVIEQEGTAFGMRWYGGRALMSMRLEKAWGVWTLDYRPDFTAGESGLDIFIQWDKDFIGKEAALAEKHSGAKKKLVTLVVNTTDFDVCNDEAVLVGDKAVGYVSSGGYAHALGKSMAFAYVPTELASAGTKVDVEINGTRYAAEVQVGALYDPQGLRMRS